MGRLTLAEGVLWRKRTRCQTPSGLRLRRYTHSRHILLLGEVIIAIGTVLVNNRPRAVRLPLDVLLPEGVQKVEIHVKGNERVISPPGSNLGQPNGVNDMHIAAHARSEGLELAINNMGELARVPALKAENWVNAAQ